MNILDYIKWRGDLSLKNDPFNEVDNLCIAQMSYTKFDNYISIDDSITIEEVNQVFFKHVSESKVKASKSFTGTSPMVLKEMAKSNRFKDMKIHHFESISNKKDTLQFCAFQVDLDDKTTYVVFRGTDDTLVGWREDFNLSYEVTKAQQKAQEYVNKFLNGNKKYIFGGHSKGGNLAIYAASKAKKRIKNRIINIYSNDGPGLNEEFVEHKEVEDILNKCIKIVPEYDFFGMIFDNDIIKHKVIESDQFAILQHDAMSWQVEGNKFKEVKSISPESKVIKKGFNDFMKEVSLTQRQEFVDEVFNSLEALKVQNISELSKATIPAFINAAKKLISMDESVKKTAMKFIQVFTKLIQFEVNGIGESIQEATEYAISSASETIGNIFKK